jgi:stage IV sporulation protein FB
VFFDPQETPYDLRWRMLDTSVRVSPWFWLMAALFGWQAMSKGIAYLLVWVACVFVSVLVHEFGHVLMGKVFGARGHIVLYSFGGLAIGSSALSNRWQRIAVYVAGPGAGFVLYGLILVIYLAAEAQPDGFGERSLMHEALWDLLQINLFWGILNLMPVYPLDGGQVSRDVFDWVIPGGQGIRVALAVSIGVAILLAVLALVFNQIYTAIFFGLLAFSSFQLMQATPVRSQSYADDRAPWERDPDEWKRGGQRW